MLTLVISYTLSILDGILTLYIITVHPSIEEINPLLSYIIHSSDISTAMILRQTWITLLYAGLALYFMTRVSSLRSIHEGTSSPITKEQIFVLEGSRETEAKVGDTFLFEKVIQWVTLAQIIVIIYHSYNLFCLL